MSIWVVSCVSIFYLPTLTVGSAKRAHLICTSFGEFRMRNFAYVGCNFYLFTYGYGKIEASDVAETSVICESEL